MIQRVWEQAQRAKTVQRVVVATDDERIYRHVQSFGGEVYMTSAQHQSGTDRCAEVASQLPDVDIAVNIQGDEPFIHPEQIDLLVEMLETSPHCAIATLAKRIGTAADLFDPNAVKVVFSNRNQALYFSRHPIPYVRHSAPEDWLKAVLFYKHIGIYAFRYSTLLEIAQLPPAPLERAEALEQLRWLAHGYAIAVAITAAESISIDTPEDLQRLLQSGPPHG